jgi:hypothetical protein
MVGHFSRSKIFQWTLDLKPWLLRSVGRSVRRGRWGVCPECQQGVEGICHAITKQVQRSDAGIEVDVMHTWDECTEQAQRMY